MNYKTSNIWFKSFFCQSYFNNNWAQLYLIFQPVCKTIKTFSCLPYTISGWESKRLSNEKLAPLFTSNRCLSLKLVWMNNWKIRLEFKGSCLKQDKAPFSSKIVIELYIVYKLNV